MDYLPVFLDIRGKKVVVDGGETLAARRVERALDAGAIVTVFDPNPAEELRNLLDRPHVNHHARVPEAGDFLDCLVAYGASEDDARDALLHKAAKQAGALVNVADNKPFCDFITPSIVDRAPVTVAISTGGAAPVIARILRARIEALLPAAYGHLAQFLSGFRRDIEKAVPTGRGRRRFWENMIDGPAADAFLAGQKDDAVAQIKGDLAQGDRTVGALWQVGTGPGDPDLLTFKALRLMQRADVVLYDDSVPPAVLALCRRDAERLAISGKVRDQITPLLADGNRVLHLSAILPDGPADMRVPGVITNTDVPDKSHEMSLTPRDTL
ncbi:siroheme synthase [Aliiroseovarius subalbicans]|uniref:siroheme synthase n=1 Tax=Aliiroseovarius subalbicans TaxID=2925840 RepID=UPI001F583F55|nr:siroheme synthase [Aliiroseovarius subalbicans]MCI2400148.1 siroheme synthase [Aliiroseovarius subalbicans]